MLTAVDGRKHFSYSDGAMQTLDKLKKRREDLNLTQGEFGAKVGVKAMTVYRWEKGESLPRRKTWRKLQEVTGLPIAEIIPLSCEAPE